MVLESFRHRTSRVGVGQKSKCGEWVVEMILEIYRLCRTVQDVWRFRDTMFYEHSNCLVKHPACADLPRLILFCCIRAVSRFC